VSRILVLNGASGSIGAVFGLLDRSGDALRVVAEELAPGRGGAEQLPVLLDRHLQATGWGASSLDVIAVVVGPGSFTGLRASLALAHGLALGGSARLVGVTVGEALGPALQAEADGQAVWCVSQARRDRVFIEWHDTNGWHVAAAMLAELPQSPASLLVGGDASASVADVLERRGVAAQRSVLAGTPVASIASAAAARLAGTLPPRAVQPLYVDPPEAKLPQPRAMRPA